MNQYEIEHNIGLADAVSFTLMSRELWKGSEVYGIYFIFMKENHSLAK